MKKTKNPRASPRNTKDKNKAETFPIRIRGAKVNNLDDLNVDLSRHQITCVCGVSGSGKSTLIFSVLAAESEARHQALLADPRRKLEAIRAPADAVVGLPFSVTVSQRSLRAQKRSTVATQTGMHGDLVALVRQFGAIRCECGCEISAPTPKEIAQFAFNTKKKLIQVFAVVFRHSVGGTPAAASEALRQGRRVIKQLDGSTDWKTVPPRGIVQDSIACAVQVGEGTSQAELTDLVSKGVSISPHGVLLLSVERKERAQSGVALLDTSSEWPCPECGTVHPRATGSLLSFNSEAGHSGRCRHCLGVGTVVGVANDLLVENPERPPLDGAFGLERKSGGFRHLGVREDTVRGVIRRLGASEDTPWNRQSDKVRHAVLNGTTMREQPLGADGRKTGAKVLYHGLVPLLVQALGKTGEAADYARSFVSEQVCANCDGGRFEQYLVQRYEYASKSFVELLSLSASLARNFFEQVRCECPVLDPDEAALLAQCQRRAFALERGGLGHLSLGRSTASLSGGELQRLKISRSLVGGLRGSCYILDEPSLGLHAADNAGLIRNLRELRDEGNTVIIADHDPDFIAAADERVYLGPGAGRHGGRLLKKDTENLPPERHRLKTQNKPKLLRIEGCSLHNIIDQTIEVPLGCLVCLTGVSGSGKSTFSTGILQPALRAALAHKRLEGPGWNHLLGAEEVEAVVAVEQQGLSRSRRSLVATYVGIMDPIRELLAATETAGLRNYGPGTFSCNRADGWCAACQGLGTQTEAESLGVASCCDACRGSRFRDAILDCRWSGLNIAEILDMEVVDAVNFFTNESEIVRRLLLLQQLGLGHLKLGRPTTNLSGGEAQRLKLVKGLATKNQELNGIVFILDEPTAGLHGHDVQALLDLLDQLVAGGRNSVIIIEHDLSVIAASDYVLDFGPGSAADGGRVIAFGTPAEISRTKGSLTGKALLQKARAPAWHVSSTPVTKLCQPGSVPTLAEAQRFSDYLNEHYDDAKDAEGGQSESGKPILPTYVLDDSGFPPRHSTILEAFRLQQALDRVLQPKLQFQPEGPNIKLIDNDEQTVEEFIGRHLVGKIKLAWTLASDAIASGKATRSVLPTLIRHAKEGASKHWTDQSGLLHPITEGDFSKSDPFHVSIVMDGEPSCSLLRHCLQMGSGWARVLELKNENRWQVKMHLVDRPLSLVYRGLAGRTLRTGLLPKSSGGACPFCRGNGVVNECLEDLVIAKDKLLPTDIRFYTPGAQSLLGAVFGRIQKSMRFFQMEGLVDFETNGVMTGTWSRQILLHGYPWARFPIPGKSTTRKVTDFYEWRGLSALIFDRLHLAKDLKWKARVEASFHMQSCAFCEGTGLDWSARQVLLGGQKLPDFLKTATFATLSPFLGDLSPTSSLSAFVADTCRIGLGHVKLMQECGSLTVHDRGKVLSLALRHLAFPEAGYVLPADRRGSLVANAPNVTIGFKES